MKMIICSGCMKLVPSNLKVCEYCGMDLPPQRKIGYEDYPIQPIDPFKGEPKGKLKETMY